MINTLKTLASASLIAIAMTAGAASLPASADHHAEKADIVATAASVDDFSTLVAAVKAAGLVEVLQGEGPFTVFAPTNAAFAALPEGTLDDLLKPENKATLAKILTYHVVPGKIMSADLLGKALTAKTAAGIDVSIDATGDSVRVDTATVVKADIATSNGVIHVIDSVILPK